MPVEVPGEEPKTLVEGETERLLGLGLEGIGSAGVDVIGVSTKGGANSVLMSLSIIFTAFPGQTSRTLKRYCLFRKETGIVSLFFPK